jgi:hypothetical protein
MEYAVKAEANSLRRAKINVFVDVDVVNVDIFHQLFGMATGYELQQQAH